MLVISKFAMDLAIEEGQEKRYWRWSPSQRQSLFGIAGYYTKMAYDEGPHRHRRAPIPRPLRKFLPSAARPCSAQSISTSQRRQTLIPSGSIVDRRHATANSKSKSRTASHRHSSAPRDAQGHALTPTPRRSANIVGKNGGGIMPLGRREREEQAVRGYRLGAVVCELFVDPLDGQHRTNAARSMTKTAHLPQGFIVIDPAIFADPAENQDASLRISPEATRRSVALDAERIWTHGE